MATSALAKEEIILGYENNTFRPKNHITRAEFAVLFMKIRDKYTTNDITGNILNNASTMPMQFLEIPNGTVGVLSIPSLGLYDLPVVEDGETLDNIKNVAGTFPTRLCLMGMSVCLDITLPISPRGSENWILFRKVQKSFGKQNLEFIITALLLDRISARMTGATLPNTETTESQLLLASKVNQIPLGLWFRL